MKKITILFAVCSLFVPWSSKAQSLITVVNQQGDPLADAVIEVQGPTLDINPSSSPDYVMDQVDKSFEPHVLLVRRNSLVRFPNSDDIRHHVYSFSQAKPFQLKLYSGQPKEPVLFDNNGVVVLGCNIHDAMVGYLYVHEHPAYKTDAEGRAWLESTLTQEDSIWLWHPRAKAGVEQRQSIAVSSLTATAQGYRVVLDVTPAQSRDSFEDVFSNAQ